MALPDKILTVGPPQYSHGLPPRYVWTCGFTLSVDARGTLANACGGDAQVRVLPGELRALYVHSALPDDLGIQYQSTRTN